MAKRKIVKINEEKCNGCGLCIPGCAEGALQIIDGKAKLVSDKYCDGLGACLGTCPMDAIEIIEREAEEFDEEAVKQYLKEKEPKNRSEARQSSGCPGSRAMSIKKRADSESAPSPSEEVPVSIKPQLAQWPVQLKLVPVNAPYFDGSHLLITADCVPFAYADYHLGLLKGKSVVVGCPKLDDVKLYIEKLTEIIKLNDIKKVTVVVMEVPCCKGMVRAAAEAVKASGKHVPLNLVEISIDGRIKK
ncbi:MAG: ATP-binding protein [Clostridia bacterium]|jgi:NAD-dependent dihydropyrimidine dehydrogenase PreA subunit|nr:4Fe-4S binding protein [Clostridiales bacterium]